MNAAAALYGEIQSSSSFFPRIPTIWNISQQLCRNVKWPLSSNKWVRHWEEPRHSTSRLLDRQTLRPDNNLKKKGYYYQQPREICIAMLLDVKLVTLIVFSVTFQLPGMNSAFNASEIIGRSRRHHLNPFKSFWCKRSTYCDAGKNISVHNSIEKKKNWILSIIGFDRRNWWWHNHWS